MVRWSSKMCAFDLLLTGRPSGTGLV
ncbi:MAG: hypothetical protein ACI905_001673, partial [Roseivirga sp.]